MRHPGTGSEGTAPGNHGSTSKPTVVIVQKAWRARAEHRASGIASKNAPASNTVARSSVAVAKSNSCDVSTVTSPPFFRGPVDERLQPALLGRGQTATH